VLEAGRPGAPLVVLLHGIGSSGRSFARQLDGLGDEFHLLAPTARGYGGSDDAPEPPGLDGYADDLLGLLDHEGCASSALVGASWGGVVATRFAARHPGRLWALVLADSSRGSGGDDTRASAMRARPAELDRLGPRAYAEGRAPRLLSDGAPAELVAAVTVAMAEAVRLPGLAHAAASMAETDHADLLAGLAVPALVVVGEHDAVCPVAESAAIAAAIPGARLEVIPGAGHLANQEQPGPFNRVVGAFLRHHRPHHPDAGPARRPTITTEDHVTIDLEALIDRCLATKATRREDWDTLAFQAKAGEQFRRAQIRYIGSGATGDHENDSRILPAEHFTFSNMVLPPRAIGPEHNHHDVEEVFFLLEGSLEVTVHDPDDGARTASRTLGPRDLVKVPAGVPRSLRNVGDTDVVVCVMLGSPKPQLPTYPDTSPVAGVTRD